MIKNDLLLQSTVADPARAEEEGGKECFSETFANGARSNRVQAKRAHIYWRGQTGGQGLLKAPEALTFWLGSRASLRALEALAF